MDRENRTERMSKKSRETTSLIAKLVETSYKDKEKVKDQEHVIAKYKRKLSDGTQKLKDHDNEQIVNFVSNPNLRFKITRQLTHDELPLGQLLRFYR